MQRDFPQPGELAPFHSIKRNLVSGKYKGYYLCAESGAGAEIGYMVLTAPEGDGAGPVFGNYFAVHPKLRSKGYGKAFLSAIVDKYRSRTIVIEVSDPAASISAEQRGIDRKRVRFYESAGFAVAPTARCRIYGADMLIMATNLYEGFSAREAILSLYDHPSAADNIDVVDA